MPTDHPIHTTTTVIGGGLIGLAIARQCAAHGPTLLIEQQPRLGTGISSRNSEVMHAGLYYPRDTLKARLCVEGNAELYAYCETHQVPHQRCGKLVVANDDLEHEHLHALALRAELNGVKNVELLTRSQAQALEPAVQAKGALLSPDTGIIDVGQLMLSLEKDCLDRGVDIVVNTRVEQITRDGTGYQLAYCSGDSRDEVFTLSSDHLINSAGLQAISLAQAIVDFPSGLVPELLLLKGNYFRYHGTNPFTHLIYPVPMPVIPEADDSSAQHQGLGIHAGFNLDNELRFGPDTEPVNREDYEVDSTRHAAFVTAIQRYFPGLQPDKLQADSAGIRPRLVSDQPRSADFMIQGEREHGWPGLVNLFGIESPGLTCCLSLARYVEQQLF